MTDGYADGFEALYALVRRAVEDGILEQRALTWGVLGPEELLELDQAYGLSMKTGGLRGRAIAVEDAGIREIRFSTAKATRVKNFDGRGNDAAYQKGAEFVTYDGRRGQYTDIWFEQKDRGGRDAGFVAKR